MGGSCSGGGGATCLSTYACARASSIMRQSHTDGYLNTCPFTQKSQLRRFI